MSGCVLQDARLEGAGSLQDGSEPFCVGSDSVRDEGLQLGTQEGTRVCPEEEKLHQAKPKLYSTIRNLPGEAIQSLGFYYCWVFGFHASNKI